MTSACQWIFGGCPLPDVLALIARSYDVMTFAAPGPNPFEADKGPQAMRDLDGGLQESAYAVRTLTATARAT
jgi:hypothetical protein